MALAGKDKLSETCLMLPLKGLHVYWRSHTKCNYALLSIFLSALLKLLTCTDSLMLTLPEWILLSKSFKVHMPMRNDEECSWFFSYMEFTHVHFQNGPLDKDLEQEIDLIYLFLPAVHWDNCSALIAVLVELGWLIKVCCNCKWKQDPLLVKSQRHFFFLN